jgi:hypothetical protein
MKNIDISHEVPLALLEESRRWNNYQYALVHLFEKYPDYSKFFKKIISEGDKVILDNSLFELKSMFDPDKFAEAIKEYKPTEYIIPDAWEDMEATIESVISWDKKYKNLKGIKIGVLQGKDFRELTLCYKKISPYVDKIAVSFKPVAFGKDEKNNKNFLLDCGINRYSFLSFLYDESLSGIKEKKPLHLLGCSLPQEFIYYRNAHFREYIETIDTSNPIIHAFENKPYKDYGLDSKSSVSIESIMEENNFSDSLVLYNVSRFRRFVNGEGMCY